MKGLFNRRKTTLYLDIHKHTQLFQCFIASYQLIFKENKYAVAKNTKAYIGIKKNLLISSFIR